MAPPFLGVEATRYIGLLLMCLGGTILLDSFARFALQGFGTPAPVFPPNRLVVHGWYRLVRNPMYVAIISLILGQAIWFGNGILLWYALFMWVGFHLFVLLYEERTLRRRFGEQYAEYCSSVPRWILRRRPWHQPLEDSAAESGRTNP